MGARPSAFRASNRRLDRLLRRFVMMNRINFRWVMICVPGSMLLGGSSCGGAADIVFASLNLAAAIVGIAT
jgi:hypothetical protein